MYQFEPTEKHFVTRKHAANHPNSEIYENKLKIISPPHVAEGKFLNLKFSCEYFP
jgi:hypothetical protein